MQVSAYIDIIIIITEKQKRKTARDIQQLAGVDHTSFTHLQLQADIIGIDVDRPAMRETTALGAAIAAGLAVKLWDDGIAEVKKLNRENCTTFKSTSSAEQRAKQFKKWERAVEMSRGWISNNDDGDDQPTSTQ